jgi:hypothetical protein
VVSFICVPMMSRRGRVVGLSWAMQAAKLIRESLKFLLPALPSGNPYALPSFRESLIVAVGFG